MGCFKKGSLIPLCAFLLLFSGSGRGGQSVNAGQEQKTPGFRIEVNQIKLSVLAIKKDEVIRDLKKENFRVWIGRPDAERPALEIALPSGSKSQVPEGTESGSTRKQTRHGDDQWQETEIKNFLNYEERSVAAFFAIDLSQSVETVLEKEKIAADHFLVSLLRPPRNMRDIAATSSFLYRPQIIDVLRPEGDLPVISEEKGQTVTIASGEKFQLTSVIGGSNKLGLIYDKKIKVKNKPKEEIILLPLNSFVLNINGKEFRSVTEEIRSDRIILSFPEEVEFSPEDTMTLSFISPEKKIFAVNVMQKFKIYTISRFKLHQEWTSDINKLKNKGVISINKPGGGTPLFDALYWMGEEFGALEGDYTKIGIVISDGVDTASIKNLDQAVEKLQNSQVMLYAVSVNPPESGMKTLEEITARTGGQLFVTSNSNDLKKQFDKIVEQIQGVYTLSFDEPPDAGKYHILVEAGKYDKNGKWKKNGDYKLNYSKLISVEK